MHASESYSSWNPSEPNLYDSTDLPGHTPTSELSRQLTFYTTDDLRGEQNTHMSDSFQQGQYAQRLHWHVQIYLNDNMMDLPNFDLTLACP
jgi:hypothetical protein